MAFPKKRKPKSKLEGLEVIIPDGWKNPSEQLVESRIIPSPPKTAKLNQFHPIDRVDFALIFRIRLGTTHPSTYEVAVRKSSL